MPGNLQGLINDQQFQAMPPAQQRQALQGVTGDKSFTSLSDGDTLQFISKMRPPNAGLAPPDQPMFGKGPNAKQPTMVNPLPTENIPVVGGAVQPFGEVAANLAYDPKFRKDTATGAATAAGVTGAAMASPLVVAAAPAIAGGVSNVAKAGVKALPYVAASEGINYARQNLPGGKYIPAGAEMLPLFMAGADKAKAAESEAVTGERVPVGKLTKEVPNPDPYKFSGAPKQMEITDSTNVGKVGYNADKNVMTVEYKNGFVYSYHGVPQEIYDGAKNSESVGSYISRNIKGRYDTVRRGSVLVKKSNPK